MVRTKITLDIVKALAKERGGECLSDEYINSKTKMTFKCCNPEHPPWEAKYHNIRLGKWCKMCYKEKVTPTLQDAQELAKRHNGKCLSEKYIPTSHGYME